MDMRPSFALLHRNEQQLSLLGLPGRDAVCLRDGRFARAVGFGKIPQALRFAVRLDNDAELLGSAAGVRERQQTERSTSYRTSIPPPDGAAKPSCEPLTAAVHEAHDPAGTLAVT